MIAKCGPKRTKNAECQGYICDFGAI